MSDHYADQAGPSARTRPREMANESVKMSLERATKTIGPCRSSGMIREGLTTLHCDMESQFKLLEELENALGPVLNCPVPYPELVSGDDEGVSNTRYQLEALSLKIRRANNLLAGIMDRLDV